MYTAERGRNSAFLIVSKQITCCESLNYSNIAITAEHFTVVRAELASHVPVTI